METNISFFSLCFPFRKALAYKSCEIAEAPASVSPDTTAKIVANATAEMKPSNISPPTASAK